MEILHTLSVELKKQDSICGKMQEMSKVSKFSAKSFSSIPSPSPKLRCFQVKFPLLVKYVLEL